MGVMDQKPMLHYDAAGNPYFGGNYFHITANVNAAQGLVDNSPTYLHRVNINKAGTAWTLTVYDGVDNTGAVVAVIDASAKGSYEFGSHQPNGLYVETAGTTPGDITLLYSSRSKGG